MKINQKTTMLVILSIFLVSFVSAVNPAKEKQIGIATYSVKSLESDIEGAFAALQKSGYKVMEISNYNAQERTVAGYSPKDYAELAAKYGLDIISSHTRAKIDANDVAGSLSEWGKVFDDHKTLGCKYVIIPAFMWSGGEEEIKKTCDLLNKIGEEANKRGIKLGYHNHSWEFDTIADSDKIIEDFIIKNTDPNKVFFQMDVFWVTIGGQDPVEYLKKYPNRIKVLHIKDDYVIGESGKIDYEAIFNQFYKNGNSDWFVEIEEDMTLEAREQMMGMMEQIKAMQRQGGVDIFQAAAESQAMAAPQLTPEEEAQNLKTSLEAISKSAKYLDNANFVK